MGFPLTTLFGRRRAALRSCIAGFLSAMALAASAARAAETPVQYLVDLRQPASHLPRVTMTVAAAAPQTEIQFPAWNNLYQIRNFVKNVRGFKMFCDGVALRPARVDRNTWRSGGSPCSNLEAQYSVRANEESPFSSALNGTHAFLNLAQLLFYLPRERSRPVRVRLLLPAGWKLATLLDEANGELEAANYDSLVDSPVEAGEFRDFEYTQGGASYRIIVHADPSVDSAIPDLGKRLVASIEKIAAMETALMRDVPFTRYTFILHFLRRTGAGGMEHAYGTAISLPAGGLGERWPELEVTLAHEFFHLWNVKRIRPQGLEPIDYTRGNDTGELWFSEGVTSTYQELALVRAGMITRLTFYARLAAEIAILDLRPSRRSQSVEQSGREAWLEKYRRYNRPDRSISYYNKGALVGFLLDLGIRHTSHNQHSLDDLMRRLDQDFARRGRFFTPADLRAILAELAPGFPVDAFFRDYVSGTRDLDYETYLGYAGLRLARQALARGRTAYHVEEIPDAMPDQLQVRDGWLEGK